MTLFEYFLTFIAAYLAIILLCEFIYFILSLQTKPKFKWEYDMATATVTLSWDLSASEDVVKQVVNVAADGIGLEPFVVPADVNSVVLGSFAENTVLTATHTVEDRAGNVTTVDVPSFTVPDLTAPAPATNFGFSYTVDPVE